MEEVRKTIVLKSIGDYQKTFNFLKEWLLCLDEPIKIALDRVAKEGSSILSANSKEENALGIADALEKETGSIVELIEALPEHQNMDIYALQDEVENAHPEWEYDLFMLEVGDETVSRDIIKTLTEYNDKKVSAIINEVNEKGKALIYNNLNLENVKKCCELLEDNADAYVYYDRSKKLLSEMEPSEGKINLEGTKHNLWKLIIFCCVGWVLFMVGCGISFVSSAAPTILIILGILIVGFDSILLVWKHGFRAAFNTTYIIETTYSDGHKTEEIDVGTTLIVQIFSVIFACVAGVVVTPIRLALAFYALYKAGKANELSKEEITKATKVPFLVGLITLVGGIVIAALVYNIGSAIQVNVKPKSELTETEMVTYINDCLAAMEAEEFKYSLKADTDTYLYYEKEIEGAVITYTCEIDNDGNTSTESPDQNIYTYNAGKWYVGAVEVDAEKTAMFNKYLYPNLDLFKTEVSDPSSLYAKNYDTYAIIYKFNKGKAYDPYITFTKDTKLIDAYGTEDFDVSFRYR